MSLDIPCVTVGPFMIARSGPAASLSDQRGILQQYDAEIGINLQLRWSNNTVLWKGFDFTSCRYVWIMRAMNTQPIANPMALRGYIILAVLFTLFGLAQLTFAGPTVTIYKSPT